MRSLFARLALEQFGEKALPSSTTPELAPFFTEGPDHVTIMVKGTNIFVNGQYVKTWDPLGDPIVINAGGGADHIKMKFKWSSVPFNIELGSGPNHLGTWGKQMGYMMVIGGDSPDYISLRATVGGSCIDGSAGNDTIVGGWGHDYLVGAGQNDRISGLSGNDTILGGAGNDTISGSNGNDLLVGDGGIDMIVDHIGWNVFHADSIEEDFIERIRNGTDLSGPDIIKGNKHSIAYMQIGIDRQWGLKTANILQSIGL